MIPGDSHWKEEHLCNYTHRHPKERASEQSLSSSSWHCLRSAQLVLHGARTARPLHHQCQATRKVAMPQVPVCKLPLPSRRSSIFRLRQHLPSVEGLSAVWLMRSRVAMKKLRRASGILASTEPTSLRRNISEATGPCVSLVSQTKPMKRRHRNHHRHPRRHRNLSADNEAHHRRHA